jgi:ATP-binding protein involved in chromosome partitioning
MAYFTPEELPENKYYIFGQEKAQRMKDLEYFLGRFILAQSIREAGDYGRPAACKWSSRTCFEGNPHKM